MKFNGVKFMVLQNNTKNSVVRKAGKTVVGTVAAIGTMGSDVSLFTKTVCVGGLMFVYDVCYYSAATVVNAAMSVE